MQLATCECTYDHDDGKSAHDADRGVASEKRACRHYRSGEHRCSGACRAGNRCTLLDAWARLAAAELGRLCNEDSATRLGAETAECGLQPNGRPCDSNSRRLVGA